MRIDEARIDEYGEKTNAIFDFSRGSFYLAFGPNEAGKSTFLEFIRNLLFDLPSSSDDASERFFSSVGAATLGGSAKFRLDDGRVGRVRRRWKLGETRRRSTFEGSLRDAATGAESELDVASFSRLLGGADRRLFATYFGFSHQELSEGKTLLTETGLSELIYGFGFGGPKTFNETKKTLKRELDAFFSASGNATKPKINAAVRRLKELDAATKEAFGSARDYSTLCKERDAVARESVKNRKRREEIAAERRDWEKKRTARTLFVAAESAAKNAAAFFANSPFSPERLAAFPFDGTAEWNALSATLRQLEGEIAELTEKSAAARSKLAQIERFPNFVAEQVRICGAALRVEEIARERTEIPQESARNERETEELERRGAEIGVDAAAFRAETTVSDAFLDRARDGADEEKRIAADARTAKKNARDQRVEIDEFERNRETATTRRIAEFGERDRADDATDFSRVEKAFALTRADAERTSKAVAALESRQEAEKKTARRLIREIFANPSDEVGADVERLENADVPLLATLSELERRGADVEKERDAAQTDAARLDDEIERLDERLGATDDWNAESDEALERLRRDRDERWTAIKSAWFDGGVSPVVDRAATVDEFERAVEKADVVADSRFKNAKSIADWEAATRTRAAKETERSKNAERIRLAEQAAANVAENARALWRRAGLDVRPDFSIAEGKEWRTRWETWATARAETRRQEAELSAESARLRRSARETAEIAARWLDDETPGAVEIAVENENAVESNVANAVDDAGRLLALAAKRVERWDELNRLEREIDQKIDAAKTKLRRLELDANAAEDARSESDARLQTTITELANESIPLEFDDARRSFGELVATLEKLRDLQKEARRIAGEKKRLDNRFARFAEFEKEIADLAIALDGEPLDARTRAEDAASGWNDRLQKATVAENAWKTASQNAAQIAETLDAKKKAASEKEARRRELAAAVDAASETEFLALGAAAETAKKLEQERKETAARLRAAFLELNDAEFARNLDSLRAVDGTQVDAKIAELAKTSDEIDAQGNAANDRLVEIRSKITILEEKEGASRIAVEREGATNELREALDLYVPRLFACRALENSLRRYEEEKRPEILDDANDIFRRVTSGRYSQIVVDKNSFLAIQRDGISKSPRELSSGTREQLYLALRLAHIRRYCESSESLPLLTDDALVNFDDARAEETLRVLADFAQKTQTILLTCRESTRRAFERVVGKETVVELNGRRFDVDAADR